MRPAASRLLWYAVLAASAVAGVYLPQRVVDAGLLVMAVLLAAGVVVTVWWIVGLVRRMWWHRWLLKHGTPLLGQPLEAQLWASPAIGVDYEGPSRLLVEVVSNGSTHRLELRQTIDVDMMPAVGDEVTVLLDPRRPQRARLAPSWSRA